LTDVCDIFFIIITLDVYVSHIASVLILLSPCVIGCYVVDRSFPPLLFFESKSLSLMFLLLKVGYVIFFFDNFFKITFQRTFQFLFLTHLQPLS